MLKDFEVDYLAIIGGHDGTQRLHLRLFSNHGQGCRPRLQMLLLLVELLQLIAADRALLLTDLLIKHLQAQLLSFQRRLLLDLLNLLICQWDFVNFVFLGASDQIRLELTLITHFIQEVS